MRRLARKSTKKKISTNKKISPVKSARKMPLKVAGKTKLTGQLAGVVKICDAAFKKMASTQQAFIKAEVEYVKAKAKLTALQKKISDKADKD